MMKKINIMLIAVVMVLSALVGAYAEHKFTASDIILTFAPNELDAKLAERNNYTLSAEGPAPANDQVAPGHPVRVYRNDDGDKCAVFFDQKKTRVIGCVETFRYEDAFDFNVFAVSVKFGLAHISNYRTVGGHRSGEVKDPELFYAHPTDSLILVVAKTGPTEWSVSEIVLSRETKLGQQSFAQLGY